MENKTWMEYPEWIELNKLLDEVFIKHLEAKENIEKTKEELHNSINNRFKYECKIKYDKI